MESNLRVEKQGNIAWLILSRPEKRNTMNWEFFSDLRESFALLDAEPDVRAIVIRAEGKMFTAGLDLQGAASLSGDGSASSREEMRRFILRLQDGISAVERCRKPVLAAVHGWCIGGGVDLLSACDIRLATADAMFSVREARIGIIADLGTLQRLPTIIGHGWSRELALTGRDFTAEEALKMGFITHVCPNQEELYKKAGEIAEEIAALPPLAVQGTKDVLINARDEGVYEGLGYVAQKNAAQVPNDDMIEALAAFMEKRKPKFTGH
jgi:enoyl-CoA hydratase